MMARIRRLHRTGPQLAAFAVLIWGLSGLLHPVMSWTAPRAAVQMPPVMSVDSQGASAPSSLAAMPETARQIRLAPSSDSAYWSVRLDPDSPRLALDAATGAPAPQAAHDHAIALARHYASLPDADIVRVEDVTQFSIDYPAINRLLPVTAVTFDTPDRLTVYVDTGSDRLAAVTNSTRRAMLRIFQTVHTLSFLKPAEPLRLLVITALTLIFISTVLAGLTLTLTAKGKGLRRWHRYAGMALALPALAFPVSGLFHAWTNSSLFVSERPDAALFAVSDLIAVPQGRFAHLAATADGGNGLWRAAQDRSVRFFAAEGAELTLSEQARAVTLAGAPTGSDVTMQTRFDGDYGFASKRLPVWRVETANGPVFVDPVDGLLAQAGQPGRVTALESTSFDNLHKWQFANPIGRQARDILMMMVIAALIGLALSGLSLARRRRR
ncbi:MAG: Optional hypothetical component of the B12 transporter BtuN [Oceanicaulis sp. HLUCCA04]|nr:MAG: Optional hypothetical component of the B12 transporter BtuN [Oceanicaulis sp. HLUCCA04]